MTLTTNPTTHQTTHQTTEKIEATVTAFGHIQPSRYSNEQVQSVLFERWDRHDESRKVWKTFSVPEARQFHKNQRVLLVSTWRKNRQVWDVERLEETRFPATPPYPKRSEYQEPEPQAQPQSQASVHNAQTIHQEQHSGNPARPRLKSQPTQQPRSTTEPLTSSSSKQRKSGLSPTEKQEIATWIAHQADLYSCCFTEAHRALSSYQPEEETVRACASSLFISATRKFRLEL